MKCFIDGTAPNFASAAPASGGTITLRESRPLNNLLLKALTFQLAKPDTASLRSAFGKPLFVVTKEFH